MVLACLHGLMLDGYHCIDIDRVLVVKKHACLGQKMEIEAHIKHLTKADFNNAIKAIKMRLMEGFMGGTLDANVALQNGDTTQVMIILRED